MFNRKAVAAVCIGVLTACQHAQPDASDADIANIAGVNSSFGPQFTVTEVRPTGIDPRLLTPQPMPPGVQFQPADCAKFAAGQVLPPGLKGNMAATTAEGEGNRFIAMAVETSEPVSFDDPGQGCQKVGFAGGAVRGMLEVVESPRIDGVRTLGTHRVLQTSAGTGELYNYVASFGTFLVIVTANPLVRTDQPVVPVNTQRARDLLAAAVTAVRG